MEKQNENKKLISALALENLGMAKTLEQELINLRGVLIGINVAIANEEKEEPHSLRENEEATNSVLKSCIEVMTQIQNNI